MKHLIIVLSLLLFTACSNSSNLPTTDNPQLELTNIKEKYADELARIQVGDYIAVVAKLFPGMYIAEDSMKNTIYAFDYQQGYLMKTKQELLAKTYKQSVQFYFVNKKLVHWQVKK